MSSVAVDLKRIENDLHSLMSIAGNEVSTLRRHIDFQEIVGSVLDKQRYTYTLKSGGDFSILAAPGMSICGKWDGLSWSVSVNISYGNLSANTSYKDSKYNYYKTVKLCPASFHEYVPIFDSLIETLRKYYAEYEATTKSNKSSQLLKQLVRPVLRKLNITEAILEPNDNDDGLLQFKRKICSNFYLSTTLDYDNYESRCEDMRMAMKNLPSVINDDFLKYIHFEKNWYKFNFESVKRPQPNSGDEIRMCYKTQYKKPDSQPRCDADIVACLDKLGFMYYETPKTNILKIRINEGVQLCRKDTMSWFSRYSNEQTKEIELSAPNFIRLLHYIASASVNEGEYPYFYINYHQKDDFFVGLQPLLKYCLPSDYYGLEYPWINIYFDENGKEGFKFSRNRSNWFEVLVYVIENYGLIKNLPHILTETNSPNVKLIIK